MMKMHEAKIDHDDIHDDRKHFLNFFISKGDHSSCLMNWIGEIFNESYSPYPK